MIIIASCPGQLGNRLILSAHIIAFAIEKNVTVLNLTLDRYRASLKNVQGDIFSRYPVRFFPFLDSQITRTLIRGSISRTSLLMERKTIETRFAKVLNTHDIKYVNSFGCDEPIKLDDPHFQEILDSSRFLITHGYFFRGEQYLEKHSELVRKYFKLTNEHTRNIETLINDLKRKSEIMIGVHIRQGDYSTFLKGKFFYATTEYIKLMHSIKELFPGRKVSFLICSNILQDINLFSDFDIKFGTGHFIEDMYSLANCNYIVGPPSSYSGWAAFYGNKPLYWWDNPLNEPSIDDFKVHAVPLN